MLDRIKACFTESIQTQIAAAEALPDAISRAAMTLVQSLLNGNKILCCGNGTSAANAQHFAASMINRFETERPGLPAIALNTDNVVLTAIANDRLHDEIYAKQVRALGHAGDVLLAISTRGNSRDIVKAVEAAVTRDMTIVALTGYDGGELVIQDTYGVQQVKLAAGDLVLYPGTSLHKVNPVTRGQRYAAFFWTQSLVREDSQRALLFEMDNAIQQLTADVPEHPALLQLTGTYHNLLRRWAEV